MGEVRAFCGAGVCFHVGMAGVRNHPLMNQPATPAQPAASQLVFGKYEVLRRLAIGGMGEVFLARQVGVPGFERYVILKNLLPELAMQKDFVDQFLDEARVIATLNHPNIVGVYEVGQWQGVYFIAMEYIHGVDLAALLRASIAKQTHVPAPVAARIVRDAALGLDHAHRATDVSGRAMNIVHRDISPQNIMVRHDGVTKVVDFGIAKASNKSSRTQTGALKGKLQYMAPEQLNGDDLDPRADQFALGVVFWELCSAKRLFKGQTDLQTFEMILHKPYPPLSAVAQVPNNINDVAMRMLSRNRDERYDSCADLAADLGQYLGMLSREIGEQQVAAFVNGLVGEELEQRFSSSNAFSTTLALGGMISVPQAHITPTSNLEATMPGRFPAQMEPAPPRWGLRLLVAGLLASAVAAGVVVAPRYLQFQDDGHGVHRPGLPSPQLSLHQAPEGAVLNVTEPVGAEVSLDGKPTGLTVPCDLKDIPPGNHVLGFTLGEAQAEAAVVVPEAEKAPEVIVESSPPRAAVWLGREPMGNTPLKLGTLRPDVNYQLRVELRGYVTETVEVKAAAGEKVVRKVQLKAVPSRPSRPTPAKPTPARTDPPEQTGPGTLSLRTIPWAKLYVDGKPVGQTPVYKISVAAGRHTLRAVNPAAGVDVTRTINVPSGGEYSDTWRLKK